MNSLDNKWTSLSAETLIHITKALVIARSIETAQKVEQALKTLGFLSLVEFDTAVGLVTFNNFRPSLVILDLSFPDMAGWQLLDIFKEAKAADNKPTIIVITSPDEPAHRLEGKLQGVESYLKKSMSVHDMQNVIRKVINV